MNTKNRRIGKLVYHTIILVFGFFMLYPVLWMLASSFKESADVFKDSYSLIPKKFMYENYIKGWNWTGGTTFTTFYKNSFIITILGTFGVVVTSTIVAYGFARIKFSGKKIWFVCMMVSMMLPGQVLVVPQYIIFAKLKWINTFLPLLVPSLFGMPFFIFLTMQFIQTIPYELDESAKIDGCGVFYTFYKIIAPLIKPAIISSSIFSFYWKWDDFFGQLLYLSKPKLYTVTLALKMFADPRSTSDWGQMFAMATLSLVPIVIVFIIFQKYLVEGVTTTGLKG